MTFFQLILSKTIISTESKPAPKKIVQKPMNYYYFGQNRFWFFTK